MLRTCCTVRTFVAAATIGSAVVATLADPPPPRRPDPISIDRASPSATAFGRSTSEIYGENPPFVFLGFGHDVGGPGPIPHVLPPNYGVAPFDETDGLSNGEILPQLQQMLYFTATDDSIGQPFTPYRNQRVRNQACGDRWVTNGFTSLSPVAGLGGGPAVIVGPFPRHILSANQTRFNLIPSIPPPAFNPGPFIPPDDMDGLEITPIDLTGDLIHDRWIYFSLDAVTAGAYGLSGADVLVSPPGVPAFGVFAPAGALGLLAAADDIDALAVWDTLTIGVHDPQRDIALFSLRRGSATLRGPDGVAGTADDYSPADIFVTSFNGTFRLFLAAGQLGMLFSDDIDGIDVEPRLVGWPVEFRDWWVQRVNIDIPYCPPPWFPGPPPPANDFHVDLMGINFQLVRNLWTGSFPNATVTPIPGGSRLSWTGAVVPPGGMAHFGWEVMDDTQVQMADMYWTIDGVRIECRRIPDLVQRWRANVDGQQVQIVDVLQNRAQEPVFVQRRAIMTTDEITMEDLMVGTDLWNSAPLVDPGPISMQPGQTMELPFPYNIQTRGYAVLYEVRNMDFQLAATYLTAMTVLQSSESDAVIGACCIDGGCIEVTAQVCADNAGTYLGDDVRCQLLSCGSTVVIGDMNCDGTVNFFDIDGFLLALLNPAAYHAQYPNCNIQAADANSDGLIDFFDIDAFLACLFGGGC